MANCLMILNLCLGIARPMSVCYCSDFYIIADNIIKISDNFEYCLIINDNHSPNDAEFNKYPPHLIKNSIDTTRFLTLENQLKSKYIHRLNKNTFSAFDNNHNKKLILDQNYNKILVTGFCTSTDILSTCIDLSDYRQNVLYSPKLTSDISLEFKFNGLNDLENYKIKEYSI